MIDLTLLRQDANAFAAAMDARGESIDAEPVAADA